MPLAFIQTETGNDNNQDQNAFGYRPRRRRNRYDDAGDASEPPLTALFSHSGWIECYSFSHGTSGTNRFDRWARGRPSELNIMCRSDKFTPMMYIASLRGEQYPVICMRTVGEPRGNRVKMLDFELRNSSFASTQLSGSSGGDAEPTRSVSISAAQIVIRTFEIDFETGDVIQSTRGYWDDEHSIGSRDGRAALPSLASIARKIVLSNTTLYDRRVRLFGQLVSLPDRLMAP